MLHSDVCYLIEDAPKARGVYDPRQATERMVYCTVQSVGRQEYYAALSAGLQPSLVLKLADMIEYQGELRLMFHDREYQIVRTYMTKDGGIELTIERKVSKS
jgi:hypothetical protein